MAKAKVKKAVQKKPPVKKASLEKQTLIDQCEDDDGHRKRERPRDDDSKLSKVVYDNFPGWSSEDLTCIIVDGKNVLDRLQDDRNRAAAGEKMVFGMKYYKELRDKYKNPLSSAEQLVVRDETELPDEALMSALEKMLRTKRDAAEFITWCDDVSQVNNLCLVAVLRQILKIHPAKSVENTMITVAVMRMICRLKLQEKWAEEMHIMQGHFDQAACKSLASFKGKSKTNKFWWESNKDWAKLVLSETAVDLCMAEEGD